MNALPLMALPWHADWLGWLAAGLMVATFGCREARCMRPLAVATNLAFIGYGLAAGLAPVLTLHAVLLPINLWRWWECRGPRRKAAGRAGTATTVWLLDDAQSLPPSPGQAGTAAWASTSRPALRQTHP